MRLACDLSNYTTVPTPQQLDCLRQAGVARAIVGCSDGTVANLQLAAFYAASFEVEAYAWVSYGQFWSAKIDRALAVLQTARGVTRLWLDVEADTPTGIDPTPAQLEARINAVCAYVRGKRPDLELGIYTGRGFWLAHGNLLAFSAMPLFTAQYTADGQPPVGEPLLYGGWQRAELWQYAGSTTTCGLNLDLCVILEEHMPTPEYDELKQDIGNTLGTLGALGTKVDALANLMKIVIPKLADEQNDDVKALLAALGGGK